MYQNFKNYTIDLNSKNNGLVITFINDSVLINKNKNKSKSKSVYFLIAFISLFFIFLMGLSLYNLFKKKQNVHINYDKFQNLSSTTWLFFWEFNFFDYMHKLWAYLFKF